MIGKMRKWKRSLCDLSREFIERQQVGGEYLIFVYTKKQFDKEVK